MDHPGTHAPSFIAQKKDYFKDAGVTVDAIDAGKGATNVAVSVAGGAYQFGWPDMPSMIRFNAMNPSSPPVAVYISFDDTPLAIITHADAATRKPADLDGKKITGGPGTAVHDTIGILLKAAHAESVKVDWVNVQRHEGHDRRSRRSAGSDERARPDDEAPVFVIRVI